MAAAARGKEELVASVVYGRSMAGGEIVPPIALRALPFDAAPLRVTVCFLGAVEKVFEEVF